MSELRQTSPERLSFFDRIRHAGFILPLRMISNRADAGFVHQEEFARWCAGSRDEQLRIGLQELEVTTLVSGHRALPREDAIAQIL